MSPLVYLALAVVIALIGSIVVLAAHRKPREGPHDSIDTFSHQLEVLGRFVDRPTEGTAPRPRRRWWAR